MRFSLSAAMLAVCVAPSAFANLVSNGDFEVPVITSPYRHVSPGDAFITDWTVTAPTANQGVDLVHEPAAGDGYANTGNQAIDMAGSPGRGSIYQDLATVAGNVYKLSFWVSTNGSGNVGGLTIEWDGLLVQTIGAPTLGDWTEHVYEVEASGPLTRLNFIGNVDGNGGGTMLDTVTVEEVPAPGALVLAGLAGAMGFRRRR